MNRKTDNVGVYIRCACKKGSDFQIRVQKECAKKYLMDKENIGTVTYYIDNGFSGTDINRPAFNELIKDIKNKKIGKIIVKDYSRISRSYIDLLKCIREYFNPNNVELISIQDNNEDIELACMLYVFAPKEEIDPDYEEQEDEE